MNRSGYTIVQAGAEVPAEEFVRRYVDLKDPAAGCRPCPDYGRYWTCPPYDVPAAEYWGRYETVLLRGMQFHFTRELLERRGTLRSLAATEEDSVYRLYYDFEQSLSHLQGHQILAINRGEKEEKLKVTVLLDREQALPTPGGWTSICGRCIPERRC